MPPRPRLPSRRAFRCNTSRRAFSCNKPPSPSAAAWRWISLQTGRSPSFPRVASTTSSSVSPAKGYQVPLILNWGVKVVCLRILLRRNLYLCPYQSSHQGSNNQLPNLKLTKHSTGLASSNCSLTPANGESYT